MAVATLVLTIIGELAKVGADAYANARQTEAALLAKLKATLTAAVGRVDAALAAIDTGRADADAKIAAGFEEPPTAAVTPPRLP